MNCTKNKTIGSIEKICKTCGKTFNVYPYRSVTANYCSYDCSGRSKSTKKKKACKTCGKEFYSNPSQLTYYKGAGKYCSRECSYKGIVKETDSRPIKDKYGRSTRKKDADWKNAVRKKDKCICQRCGIYDEAIHTHHIYKRSTHPELKRNIDNGICLCNSCHAWVHNNSIEAEMQGYLQTNKYRGQEE